VVAARSLKLIQSGGKATIQRWGAGYGYLFTVTPRGGWGGYQFIQLQLDSCSNSANVTEQDANTINADIVTKDKDALVQRYTFNRQTGFYHPVQQRFRGQRLPSRLQLDGTVPLEDHD